MTIRKQLSTWIVTSVALLTITASPMAQSTYAAIGDQLYKLVADDGVAGDNFGYSVAVAGTVVIGAPDPFVVNTGSAYLFDPISGNQIGGRRTPSNSPGDQFGISVASFGNKAVIGAIAVSDNNITDTGAAFVIDTTTGNQLRRLVHDNPTGFEFLGRHIAINGNTALVMTSFRNQAFLFDVTTGNQLHELVPDLTSAGNLTGSVSGTFAILGSRTADDNIGAAFVFDVTSGNQIHRLVADDGTRTGQFGSSVAVTGNTAFIGARGEDHISGVINSGAVYVFDLTTGNQIDKFFPDDITTGAGFGNSMAIVGDTVIIGAPGAEAAYLFNINTRSQIAKLTPDDGAPGDRFGFSVAIGEGIAVVGAPVLTESGIGAAYVFATIPEPTSLISLVGISFMTLLCRRMA